LFTYLGKGGVEWKGRGRVGEERAQREGAYGAARNRNARKIAPKCNTFGIMGTPLGGYHPVPYIFR